MAEDRAATPGDREEFDDSLGGGEEEAAQGVQMPFMAHLEELRTRLVRSAYAIGAFFLAAFGFKEHIYEFITRPLIRASGGGVELVYLDPTEAFFTYLKVSFLTAVVAASPVIFYQLWRFVSPGLYKTERRLAWPFVSISSVLFISGAVFCFTTVFPYALQFLKSFETKPPAPIISSKDPQGVTRFIREEIARQIKAKGGVEKLGGESAPDREKLARGIENRVVNQVIRALSAPEGEESQRLTITAQWTMQKYLSFTSTLLLAFGIVFEMPLVLVFLGRLGAVTSRGLRKKRKYAILAMFVVGAFFTPPDPMTQILMAFPMIFLYEISIWMVAATEKKKAGRESEWDSEEERDPKEQAEETAPD